MALTIKDAKTCELVCRLAKTSGEAVERVVRVAVEERKANDILGYDERGLPN